MGLKIDIFILNQLQRQSIGKIKLRIMIRKVLHLDDILTRYSWNSQNCYFLINFWLIARFLSKHWTFPLTFLNMEKWFFKHSSGPPSHIQPVTGVLLDRFNCLNCLSGYSFRLFRPTSHLRGSRLGLSPHYRHKKYRWQYIRSPQPPVVELTPYPYN